MDNIIEKLKNRFTTKIFDSNFQIGEDVEEKIVEMFNLAPTSFGLQPFKLLKISNKKDRDAILQISWGQKQVVDCSLLYVLAIETDIDVVLKRYEESQVNLRKIKKEKTLEYSEFVRNFLSQRAADANFYDSWATRQMYLALGFFLSMAAILDIDTAPLEGFDEKKLDEIFGLNKLNLRSKALLCIGKRFILDEYPKLPKIRKSRSDLILDI